MLAAGLIVARFVHYGAILALFGASLYPHYAGRSVGPEHSWVRRFHVVAALVGLLSAIAWFLLTTASMAGDLVSALDPEALEAAAFQTLFGQVWIGRMALLLAALALALRRSAGGSWARTMLAGMILASVALTGHGPTPEGAAGAEHAAFDALHLLAAGTWLGGLPPLWLALRRGAGAAGVEALSTGELLMRFSRIGYLAVAALVVSGVANSWWLVGSIPALLETAYGRVLLAKIAFALGMVLIAAMNRFIVTPRLAEPSDDAERWLLRIRRHVLVEQALGLAVVATVAILGTMQPPTSVG